MSERTDESVAERFSKASCVEQAIESLVRANELASVRVRAVQFYQILKTSVLCIFSSANRRIFLENVVKRLRENVSHSVSPRSL